MIPSEELMLLVSEVGYRLASALHDPESDDEDERIRHACEEMHFDDVIKRALSSGALQPRAPGSGLPMSMAVPTSVVSVKDLALFLDEIQCTVQIQRSSAESIASAVHAPIPGRITFSWPMFERLQPCSEWQGGRMTEMDILSLEDAARFASKHAGEEVTQGDFLRAAGRGEITLRAVVHRTAKVRSFDGGVYCNKGEPNENIVPAGCIATLPLTACQALANVGRANWRTFDSFKEVDGHWLRFAKGFLTDDEPDFETVLGDCRVTGNDVHALADAYREPSSGPTNLPEQNRDAQSSVDSVGTPLPLTTSEIAFCFDGIKWAEQQWFKPLGDKPKWLQHCIAIPGRQGVSEIRWNPVRIGAALVDRGSAKARTVRARFQTKPQLKEWLDAWKTYEAEHLDNQ